MASIDTNPVETRIAMLVYGNIDFCVKCSEMYDYNPNLTHRCKKGLKYTQPEVKTNLALYFL